MFIQREGDQKVRAEAQEGREGAAPQRQHALREQRDSSVRPVSKLHGMPVPCERREEEQKKQDKAAAKAKKEEEERLQKEREEATEKIHENKINLG